MALDDMRITGQEVQKTTAQTEAVELAAADGAMKAEKGAVAEAASAQYNELKGEVKEGLDGGDDPRTV